ncbi:uncharacterized protein LOC116610261 [Nematostella vectensis]|uniref:uncharacterized protein LOC116610261 n=1 Tax=Nematostella vectensis TaxID=45351 RepID=UPI00207769BD|nr:uncharacterized protein LOC116610261 [Nematostella vectensis]
MSDDEESGFIMLYPDFQGVKYIPGTCQNFVLDRYKECLGKPYNRITFYIVNRADYASTNKETSSEDEDGVEEDKELMRMLLLLRQIQQEKRKLCQIAFLVRPAEAAVIAVRRSQIRWDLIDKFKDPSFMNRRVVFEIINERGEREAGEGIGVVCEVYTLFWNEFSNSMTIGERERVPFICHDSLSWEAVGRILVKGYESFSYFPLFLSKVFICFCLFDNDVQDDLYLDSFKRYLSASEEELMEDVIKGNDPTTDEFQRFLGEILVEKIRPFPNQTHKNGDPPRKAMLEDPPCFAGAPKGQVVKKVIYPQL